MVVSAFQVSMVKLFAEVCRWRVSTDVLIASTAVQEHLVLLTKGSASCRMCNTLIADRTPAGYPPVICSWVSPVTSNASTFLRWYTAYIVTSDSFK